ncbi:amino acid permease-domain-containing protein [Aspergillus parasiticus]|uniref:Amino acid permease-domain-containing protein n=1 Tax=Aspergillus parasiticus TaxID=5067 RepID=A0A5N6DYA8_ASPPA|nr:amino acid permease-domain-containing protein [Aspergillus parasiticus]
MSGFADFDAGHRDLITVTKFNFYGNRIVTASSDHRMKVWDQKDGEWQLTDTWRAHDAEIRDASWNGPFTGQHIGSVGEDMKCKIWQEDVTQPPNSGRRFRSIFRMTAPHRHPFVSIDFRNIDLESWLAVITRDGFLMVMEPVSPDTLADWQPLDQFRVCTAPQRGEETSFKVQFHHDPTDITHSVLPSSDRKSLSLVVAAMDSVKVYRTDASRRFYHAIELSSHGGLEVACIDSKHLDVWQVGFSYAGPTLGTGLFIGSGQALAAGGPASLLGSYIFISILVYCVSTAVAEIAAHLPSQTGTMVNHTYRYASSHLGFSLGYLRWFSIAALVPFEITNAMVNLGLWNPGARLAVRISIVTAVVFFFNMLPEKAFKRSEAAFTALKLVTTIGLIIISGYLAVRGVPESAARGFRYWHEPGAMNEYLTDGHLGRLLGLVQCILCSAISFIFSPELIVQRAEHVDSESVRNALDMTRIDCIHLFALYILSSLAITVASPSDEPLLTNHGIGAGLSPYIVGIRRSGIPILPTVATALIFLSSVASGRSFLYISSRTLCSLAETGHGPELFKVRNGYGVPYISVIISALFSGFAYLSLAMSASVVFNLLMYFITTSGYISWLFSCVIYFQFRRTIALQGFTPVNQTRIQPYGAYFGIAACTFLPLANALLLAAPSWAVARNSIPAYIAVSIFLLLYFGHLMKSIITQRRLQSEEPQERGCGDMLEKCTTRLRG